MEEVKREEYKGCTIKVYIDESPEDPRQWDHLGTMLCSHPRYDLGDVNFEQGIYNDETELLEAYAPKNSLWIPLLLLDHSGLYLSTTRYQSDAGGWDTSRIGIIYAEPKKIREWYNVKNITPKIKEMVYQELENEVKDYAKYISGEVYGYIAENRHGEEIESSWGYYEEDHLMENAKSDIDFYLEREQKKHENKLKQYITNHVPLEYRTF